MSYKGKVNVYVCTGCRYQIVTVDRNEGTTPMFLACRGPERGINGGPCEPTTAKMVSRMYDVPQDGSLEPTHEWYKPRNVDGLDEDTRWHVNMGGLLLRRIGEPEGE